MLDVNDLSKIGIGSYGVGGRGHRDVGISEKKNDNKYIEAIAYTLDKGSNFTEISAGYGHGNSMKLFKKGIEASSKKREQIFLTNSIYPRDIKTFKELINDVQLFHDTFETKYADSTLVTQSVIKRFGDSKVYKYLNELLKNNMTRYVSIANSGPEGIRSFKKEFGDTVFANEGHISYEVRLMQEKGVFELCKKLNIKNIIWRPLRRNLTANRNWEILIELSKKYNKTQNQIILNWITKHLGFSPMVMSSNLKHIDENIASTEFEMEKIDYIRIDNFSNPNFKPPLIDWEKTGTGESFATVAVRYENYEENLEYNPFEGEKEFK